jgi:hypothetical protein
MSDRGRRVAKSIVFAALALALSLVAVELALRLAAAAIPEVDAVLGTGSSPTVPDPVLGHRPSPHMSDSDRTGFRNPKRPRSVRIVAIGDSQTYGMGVSRHELVLAREALDELDPDVIVVAIYAGNDLLDSWTMVHQRGQLQELLADGSDQERVGVTRSDDPPPQAEWQRLRETTAGRHLPAGGLRSVLAQHTRLYGLLRAVKRTAARSFNGGAGAERSDPDPEFVRTTVARAGSEMLLQVQAGTVTTVLTPSARRAVVDLSDARIREGLRLSLEAIRRIHLEASEHETRLVVLTLPTKELVFSPWVDVADGAGAIIMQGLVDDENRIWGEFAALCDHVGIECVSALDPLREAVRSGSNPYFSDWDGHPSQLGHRVIARTVAGSATIGSLMPMP